MATKEVKKEETADQEAIADFKEAVNMTASEIEKWLDTEESKKVGYKVEGESESVGHKEGKKIVELLNKKDDYSADDLKHLYKVVGYIKRHLAQKPDGDVTETNWRYSLMNWGHDPAK